MLILFLSFLCLNDTRYKNFYKMLLFFWCRPIIILMYIIRDDLLKIYCYYNYNKYIAFIGFVALGKVPSRVYLKLCGIYATSDLEDATAFDAYCYLIWCLILSSFSLLVSIYFISSLIESFDFSLLSESLEFLLWDVCYFFCF